MNATFERKKKKCEFLDIINIGKCHLFSLIFLIYVGRLYGFGELAFGGVDVVILRMPSPSQIYLPMKRENNKHKFKSKSQNFRMKKKRFTRNKTTFDKR